MPILTRVLMLHWKADTRDWYESKGYKFTDWNKPFKVLVKDIIPTAPHKVTIKCDFCGKIDIKQFRSCQEICNCRDKACIKKRKEMVNMKRYGVKYAFQAESVKKKISDALKQKYGVEKVGHIPGIHDKVVKTKQKRGSIPSSWQQNRLAKLFGGELNYPIKSYAADVALLLDRIVIEYNGSGHNLMVQQNFETQEDFNIKEKNRLKVLIEEGWKVVIIQSFIDNIGDNFTLKKLFQYAKKLFNQGLDYIIIDFDKGYVITEDYTMTIQNALLELRKLI